jgi:dTMP kinase
MTPLLHKPAGNGIFITIEGPDGSGKSTQSDVLVAWLRERTQPVVLTREPGGTPLGEAIRAILLDPVRHAALADETELFLFAAGRAQHVRERILPALQREEIVVASRYADATEAYQGFGRGLPLALVTQVNFLATGGLMPDLTIMLDLDCEEGLRRARAVNKETPSGEMDRIEAAGLAFHQRVRDGYLTIARREPKRCVVIDGARPIDLVARAIRTCVTQRFGL